ncbi:MAG TPA: KTSC domain-containing protein [Allosphingosinicella sp.]|jgi:hypothetical protein
MRAARLSSRVIARIAYDEEERSLSIWFRETGRYIYSDVPTAIYEALRKAPSAGRFYNECIKRRFDCRPDPERRRFRPPSDEDRGPDGGPPRPSGLTRRMCGG